MRIILSEFAQRELDEAVFFYEMQQQGSGKRFRKEVYDSIDRIKHHPQHRKPGYWMDEVEKNV